MSSPDWTLVLRSASESLKAEGRHNQAGVLKDAAEYIGALRARVEELEVVEREAESALSRIQKLSVQIEGVGRDRSLLFEIEDTIHQYYKSKSAKGSR
jgi:hypothetical protein